MSHYDRDYYNVDRHLASGRVVDPIDNVRRPVMKTVGAGSRARVTVETGDDSTKYDTIRREQDAARIIELKALRERERLDKSKFNTYERIQHRRRNSSPIRTTYSSPIPRHSRPYGDRFGEGSVARTQLSDDASDEDGGGFDFTLPKLSKGIKSAGAVAFELPDSASLDSSHEPLQVGKHKFSGQMTEICISHSRWIGSPFERGDLGGEIVTLPTTIDSAEKSRIPSMRWYHLERSMMNFEEFTAASLSVLQLPEKEIRDVTKLLRDVQKRFEKQRHHGRDMEPDCVSDVFFSNASGVSGKGEQTESVIFMSFPYFSLDHYSSAQIKALTPESPSHPLRPMLQAHFYATSRQRELEQVITRTPGIPQGDCLHISQIWSLIINGSTMITCSRLQIDALLSDTIRRTPLSSQRESAHLKVSVTNNRSWRVPLNLELSWPAFLSNFADQIAEMELYGGNVQFEDDSGVVDGSNWADFIKTAVASPSELRMKYINMHPTQSEMQVDNESTESDSGEVVDTAAPKSLQPEDDIERQLSRDIHEEVQALKAAPTLPLEMHNTLQLFKHAGSSTYMRSLADGFHSILRYNERGRERAAYRKCPSAKAADIDSWIALHGDQEMDNLNSREKALLIKYKRKLASISKYFFSFFWPPEFEHAMTDKYWGAIYQILSRENEFFEQGNEDPNNDLVEASELYHQIRDGLLPRALSIAREYLNYENDLRPLPEAFSKAWLHVITAFVMTSQQTTNKKLQSSKRHAHGHLQSLKDDLSRAHRELSARLRKVHIEDSEACHESGLLALLVNRLARDNIHGRSDIARAYGDYFQGLEFNITQDPVPRSHQETIRFFLQEVVAILKTLQNQLSVIEVFEKSLEQQIEHDDLLFEEALGESRQSLVIESCRAWVGGRIDKFKGLQQRALELGEWHRNEMDTNKDRQEKAILVFTIVTIIFLPLSFVSSVFGMNTKDIRDMPFRQWIYWAVGLPLTVIVVVASLWFAGELESLGRFIARTMSRSKSSSDYLESRDQKEMRSEKAPKQQQGMQISQQFLDPEELRYTPRRRTTYPIKAG